MKFNINPELSDIYVGVKYDFSENTRANDKVIFSNHVNGLTGEITGIQEDSLFMGKYYLEFCCVVDADY